MAEQLLSMTLVVAVVIVAIALVFTLAGPVIEEAGISAKFDEAESALSIIRHNVQEVVDEGPGASRVFAVKFPEETRVLAQEDAVQYRTASPVPVFDYLSRTTVAPGLFRISEQDSHCEETSDGLVLENRYLRVRLQHVPPTEPLQPLDTKNTIQSMTIVEHNETIYPVDSSIFVDLSTASARGAGYTELLAVGSQPVCIAHTFVDSPIIDYDVYYKLYSGADFLVVEVRNIR